MDKMEFRTISQVSKLFNISTRTLRYYEQIGLIKGGKINDYAYRTYDDNSIQRLQQIIVLRKLRIPLKQIIEILNNKDAVTAIEILQCNLNEIDDELTALSTIKSILKSFINQINESVSSNIKFDLLGDETILKITDALTITKINFKEEKSMEDLNQANRIMCKLTDKDVRIIYLPPSVVAAYQYLGDDPEEKVSTIIDEFVKNSNLTSIKPDLRHFGFNAPMPDKNGNHGYEMWVTIPDNMDVPKPLTKKNFEGGLYAAHMIPMGAFSEWEWLIQWVNESEKYDYRGEGNYQNMFGCLEESLNYVNRLNLPDREDGLQLDLLYPVMAKNENK